MKLNAQVVLLVTQLCVALELLITGLFDDRVENTDIGSFGTVLLIFTIVVLIVQPIYLRFFSKGATDTLPTALFILPNSILGLAWLPTLLWLCFRVLDSNCKGTLSDYTWYVLDNVAKGALVDFLESYGIDLWTCPPTRNLIVDTLSFGIRSFVTYLIVWSLFRVLWFWRSKGAE